MRVPGYIVSFFIFLYASFSCLCGQESFYDPATKKLLDSLDQRINTLEREIPRLAESRAVNYFFVKRDLDFTIFLSHYYRLVFDEELEKAQDLVKSRLKSVQKRGDRKAEDFYKEYRKKITSEIADQQRKYQALFAKEKIFKKEFYRFVNEGDEYSLKRAQRMTDLALKYALEKKLTTVYLYLHRYKTYINSIIFDFYYTYDLAILTESEKAFQKIFNPLVESDSLELIKEAGKLAEHCYTYASNKLSSLDTLYFARQENLVVTSIADYYKRKGSNSAFASIGGQSTIARLDTLNRAGIYKWHDKIVVVGYFQPAAKNYNVKKGEAILNADRKLIEYIRINRLAKLGKVVRMGHTYLIPFKDEDQVSEFRYNPTENKYQYIVCYTRVESTYFTRTISKFLPPLQFDAEMQSL
ncbi:hypothetical protein ES703_102634 [subsurface metagenome]